MKYLPIISMLVCLSVLTSVQMALGAPPLVKTKVSPEVMAKISQALLLQKRDQNGEAILLLKPLSADLPRHGLLALAKAYHSQKNFLEETRILEIVIGQNDKDYYVQNLLAECYLANRDFEKAADNFSLARELKKDYLPAYQGLKKTYEAKGQVDDARLTLMDMIRIFGEKKFYLNEICRLYSVEGSVQEGINACQKATSSDPNYPANHIYLGRMLIENEQAERGEMIILKAAKQFQKSDMSQIAAGNLKFKHKQWRAAADIFAQATIANPLSDEGFIGWARSLFEMQKYIDAKIAFTQACSLNKKYLPELRNAIAELRQKNQLGFVNQYESVLPRCGG